LSSTLFNYHLKFIFHTFLTYSSNFYLIFSLLFSFSFFFFLFFLIYNHQAVFNFMGLFSDFIPVKACMIGSFLLSLQILYTGLLVDLSFSKIKKEMSMFYWVRKMDFIFCSNFYLSQILFYLFMMNYILLLIFNTTLYYYSILQF
jgi:hypothetical protein